MVSRLRGGCGASGMPHYVALGGENGADPGDPAYLGAAYKPFTGGQGLSNLSLVQGVTPAQLSERKQLRNPRAQRVRPRRPCSPRCWR